MVQTKQICRKPNNEANLKASGIVQVLRNFAKIDTSLEYFLESEKWGTILLLAL